VKCPKCGREPGLVYPMAEEALSAWRYHEAIYGSGVPPVYVVLSLGDYCIYLSAVFLDAYFRKKPEDEEAFIRDFVHRIEFDEEEYMREHFVEYFRHLLYTMKSKNKSS